MKRTVLFLGLSIIIAAALLAGCITIIPSASVAPPPAKTAASAAPSPVRSIEPTIQPSPEKSAHAGGVSTVKSGRFSVTAAADWKVSDISTSQMDILAVENPTDDSIAAVFMGLPLTDAQLGDSESVYQSIMTNTASGITATDSGSYTLDGNDARYFEFTGYDKTNAITGLAHYAYCFMIKDDYLYIISCIAPDSLFGQQMPAFQDMIKSYKIA